MVPDPNIIKGFLAVSLRLAERMATYPDGRAVLGQTLAVTIPLLGGLLAAKLFTRDLHRIQQERQWLQSTNSYHSLSAYLPLLCCGVKGVADMLDAGVRLAVTYGKARHGMTFMGAEEVSLTCAIVSTLCAMMADVWGSRRRVYAGPIR